MVSQNTAISSTNAVVNLEIERAQLRKRIVDDSSKMLVAENSEHLALKNKLDNITSKAKLLRDSLNISKARMNTLNTKIVSLVNRGNAHVRKYFHHIIQEAKSRSEENIRVSILAAETAQKTINFTAINDDVGSACKPDDSVSCAHSCCPK